MKHEKTVIYFSFKGKNYKVEYHYGNTTSREVCIEKNNNKSDSWNSEELQASVYENDELITNFNPIPSTNARNPTKSQASELIRKALKKKKV